PRRDWSAVASTALADVRMLRTELIVGYLIAGYAAALIPPGWLAGILHAVGAVPYVGYVLLLATGLAIAIATFVCSMGNVPVARFLANAGIPLGANTTFIYGDLLILPLIAIYRKSFPPQIVTAFIALFAIGAMFAGAVMEKLIGSTLGGTAMGSMAMNDRFTLIANIVSIAAVLVVAIAARRRRSNVSLIIHR
ncbi:MAG TPA: permease, partial [Candidatus Cybelea sp.]|nr:permease [Candidatus Cybelea sp.]